MKWYNYIACFFAGMFLVNSLPHFMHGISGDGFPTPFANPPGKGLSSPTTNVLWGILNMIVGYLLFRIGKITSSNKWSIFVFFIGIAFMSIFCSIIFIDKLHQ